MNRLKFIVLLILVSCSDKREEMILNDGTDCWIHTATSDSITGKFKSNGGGYSYGNIFLVGTGYIIRYMFGDSSISFHEPYLHDAKPSTLSACSFDWKIRDDSLLIMANHWNGKYSEHLKYLSKDTMIIGGRKVDWLYVRLPIGDTAFIPGLP